MVRLPDFSMIDLYIVTGDSAVLKVITMQMLVYCVEMVYSSLLIIAGLLVGDHCSTWRFQPLTPLG